MSRRRVPGPTGDFPHGRLNGADEGGLQVAVTEQNGVLMMHFGVPVKWIGLRPEDATAIAHRLLDYAARHGQGSDA